MLEVSQVIECKQLSAQGLSIRAISRKLSVSRNTVRGYLRGERQPGEYGLSERRRKPVSGPLSGRVVELLSAERSAKTPRKQRLTAARIFRLLAREGIHASASTVRAVVKRARLELRDPLEHAFLTLAYSPGEDAQVDFFEGVVDDLRLGRTKCFILLVRACYSSRTFAYAAPNQTREALFEGLIQAFEYFGGVFRKVWFDNLTPAVKRVLRGRTREEQRAFACFRAHYGFEAEFCAPGKGNEKGGVEGAVKYSRHEILSPIPKVAGRSELQSLCSAWMERELVRTPSGSERTIEERWQDEVPELMALPLSRFDASFPRKSKVSPRSWIAFGTNYYSVPVEWVGHEVEVKVSAEQVLVVGPGGERALHARSYGRYQMVLELDHYLPLLRRKSRGIDRALPLKRFLEVGGEEWRVLLSLLRQREGEVQGSQAFVDTLLLCRSHGLDAVRSAVREALGHPQVSLAVVRFYLWQRRAEEAPRSAVFNYQGPRVMQGSALDYAVLQEAGEVHHG